jgi:hypothetical protein
MDSESRQRKRQRVEDRALVMEGPQQYTFAAYSTAACNPSERLEIVAACENNSVFSLVKVLCDAVLPLVRSDSDG